ncbi:YolD-like family protein [Staphylococcus aureus]|uniref:YolD-like protein n=1 Tax=Staphylococcus aureus TaxID=1280 RepID=A0A1W5T8W7_STAAU|nr:YolD-like family protein [Staphylococcus aureus]ARF19441.1 YolD-like protein [Staphylococcus aureus]PZG43106.1 YolD-like family protein [Staphylococcus aureus]PZG71173.1 YolD-like family protein [Staphylococcus aureus]PZI34379.1 YolD-like family protein [Staphylococcus aureus]CAC6169984.1 YolD-like protein [Staphylococcus aureus]
MYVVNTELPERYKYETDYRKIPREYLNSNIPKGRYKVKWAPFKTVSNQYKLLDEYIEEQNKVDMLLLSDDQLQILNETVYFNSMNNILTELCYWDNGYIHSIQCYINKMDIVECVMVITTKNSETKIKIPINNIISVT